MTGLDQALAGWALAATMAAVTAALLLRTGRRRIAINEALHELRRPLQALALSGSSTSSGVVDSSTRLAAVALERLDREVNGGHRPGAGERFRCEAMMRSAVGRWRARVALDGGSLELRWRAGDAAVFGERAALEQAVDNLIVNAIEHGGPEILVEGRRRGVRLIVSVADSRREAIAAAGRSGGRQVGGARPQAAIARVTGRRRHGHGLAVVRRVATAHRGSFVLRRAAGGSVATLDLPLAPGAIAPLDPAA
jgi:signal transduction histidine kinase